MKIWKCNLCLNKAYIQRKRLVRHLVSVHRKQMFPKDELLKSADNIADECEVNFNITKEVL